MIVKRAAPSGGGSLKVKWLAPAPSPREAPSFQEGTLMGWIILVLQFIFSLFSGFAV